MHIMKHIIRAIVINYSVSLSLFLCWFRIVCCQSGKLRRFASRVRIRPKCCVSHSKCHQRMGVGHHIWIYHVQIAQEIVLEASVSKAVTDAFEYMRLTTWKIAKELKVQQATVARNLKNIRKAENTIGRPTGLTEHPQPRISKCACVFFYAKKPILF